jgi:hypothetical protein
METVLGIVGLLVIPPVVGSFVFLKEETTIQVESCKVVHGRRGSAENVYTDSGERLEIAPTWLGGPDEEEAHRKLCPARRADVVIRGARIDGLPFLHRMIFGVR